MVSVHPVRAPFQLGQCDAVHMVVFQLEQVSGSQHVCIVPFLGACIPLLDGDGEEPSLLKQRFLLVGMNVSSSCPPVGTGARKERDFFQTSKFFPSFPNFLFLFIHKQVIFNSRLEIKAFSSHWFAF